MADKPINTLPVKSSPTAGDKMLMIGTAEEYQIDYDQLATAILNKLSTQSFSSLDTTSKTVLGAVNELNGKSKAIHGNKEISIEIKKNSNILIIIGKSLMNAGRYIYAASSNAETIYTFTKIAGSDDNVDFETEVDGFKIIFRANTYMDAIILIS